ncbi:MAG: hypothetical protein KJ955_00190 [Nanoarchaeota archaeon]|nr:hypothetical protein [Nanoarchaeota archaeon]
MAETKESKPKEERPSGEKAAKAEKPKFEAKKPLGTSVRSYQRGINAEKQRMADASRKFEANVKSLEAGFKRSSKDIVTGALLMREEGAREMKAKVGRFQNDIKAKIKADKESVSRFRGNVQHLSRECRSLSREFQSYAINAFWGR